MNIIFIFFNRNINGGTRMWEMYKTCNLVYGWFELEALEKGWLNLAEFGIFNEYLPEISFKNVNIRSQIFDVCNQILKN